MENPQRYRVKAKTFECYLYAIVEWTRYQEAQIDDLQAGHHYKTLDDIQNRPDGDCDCDKCSKEFGPFKALLEESW